MIPLAVPNLAGREAAYLEECIRSTFVSSVGPFVGRFEAMVAEAAGAPQAVATSAGTTALHAALLAVGVERDDLVLSPALTFIATANAIAHCGAMPWLLDVSEDSWTLDPEQAAAVLERDTRRDGDRLVHRATGRRVSAMLPVYTLGMPADMDRLCGIARRHGLAVVADAAAALGASYKGRRSGDLGADLTMYSFNGNKTVTAGGGGAVTGHDAGLVRRVRHLTTTARTGTDYDHDIVGYNYRMTNLQAAVGCAQMEQLDGFVAAKRAIAHRYAQAFAPIRRARPFPSPAWAEGAAWFSGFALDGPGAAADASALRAHLRAHAIDARPFWKPMHLQAPYRDAPRAPLPVTERVWDRIVTLPCSTNLDRGSQDTVVAQVLSWFAARMSGSTR